MAVFNEKRVMLSYNWMSQKVVSKVYNSLKSANIPVWMDIKGGMKDDIYKRYIQLHENSFSPYFMMETFLFFILLYFLVWQKE